MKNYFYLGRHRRGFAGLSGIVARVGRTVGFFLAGIKGVAQSWCLVDQNNNFVDAVVHTYWESHYPSPIS